MFSYYIQDKGHRKSFNPARSFGPALVAALSGNGEPLGALWVFVVGLLVGAALAACVYKTLEMQ